MGAPKKGWQPNNDHQEFLVEHLANKKIEMLETLLGSDIFTKASVSDSKITIRTILNVEVQWLKEGAPVDGKYKGVLLKNGFKVFDNNVVCLETKSGDLVYIRAGVVKAHNVWDFVDKVHELVNETKYANGGTDIYDQDYTEVSFPVTAVEDQSIDMDSVVGLGCCKIAGVSKASQAVSFHMDEVGAKVKAKVKVQFTKSRHGNPVRFTIDGPFVVWVCRPGNRTPYFCANITRDFLTRV